MDNDSFVGLIPVCIIIIIILLCVSLCCRQASTKKYAPANISSSVRKPLNVIDLHGFRVGEALKALKYKLERFSSAAKVAKQLVVVTGQGLHSKNGPRIKPAVKKFLIKKGLRYKKQRKNPGALVVETRRMEPCLCV